MWSAAARNARSGRLDSGVSSRSRALVDYEPSTPTAAWSSCPARFPWNHQRVQISQWRVVASDARDGPRRLFVRPDGEVVVHELNTIPGFTATIVYAKLFEASGVPYRS